MGAILKMFQTPKTTATIQPVREGWRISSIGDLCEEDRQIVDPSSETAAKLPYIGLEDVESVTGRITKDLRTPVLREVRSASFAFDTRHVLYGKLRPYLNKVACPNFAGRCTMELIPILPHPGVDRDFLTWLLRRPATVDAAMRHKTGARMPRANMIRILEVVVDIPIDPLQQRAIAWQLDAQFRQIQQARDACRRQELLLDRVAAKLLEDFPLAISEPV